MKNKKKVTKKIVGHVFNPIDMYYYRSFQGNTKADVLEQVETMWSEEGNDEDIAIIWGEPEYYSPTIATNVSFIRVTKGMGFYKDGIQFFS